MHEESKHAPGHNRSPVIAATALSNNEFPDISRKEARLVEHSMCSWFLEQVYVKPKFAVSIFP